MKTLDNIVRQYLEMKTKYAIVITGTWGSGKTYYYQNVLKGLIKNISTESDASKKYKPISISLFGINSLDDIQTQIILELFPIAKNKKVKLSASFAKAFVKGFMKMNGLASYYDIVADIEIDKKEWIKFDELVIVFDDLERISKTLDIEDVIGFINSLVESQNFKVIIIANEDKIQSKMYFKIKEKVVGNSIEFIPDLSESFDGLITNFDGSETYQEFLQKQKEEILNTFSTASTNLRILSFTLFYFQKIYSEFTLDNDIEKVFAKNKNPILRELLKFCIAITIEYKRGKISFKDRGDLDKFFFSSKLKSLFKKETSTETSKPYPEKFKGKYYPEDDFKFYSTIYDYITGGDIFVFSNLKKELYNFYGIVDNIPQPHLQLINNLNYRNCFNLSDVEYETKTKEMIKYAKDGLYPLSEYLTVFHFATRFGNLLKLNVGNLYKSLVKGMSKCKDLVYNPSLEMYLSVSPDGENSNYLIKLKDTAIAINEALKNNEEKNEVDALEVMYLKDFEEFYSIMFAKYHYNSILDKFNPDAFFKFYLNSSNRVRNRISEFLRLRYHQNIDVINKEQIFIRKIQDHLVAMKNSNADSLSIYMATDLNSALDILIKKMEKYS